MLQEPRVQHKTASAKRSVAARLKTSGYQPDHRPGSAGVSETGPCPLDGASLLRRADRALYQAKNEGRDLVCVDANDISHDLPDTLEAENFPRFSGKDSAGRDLNGFAALCDHAATPPATKVRAADSILGLYRQSESRLRISRHVRRRSNSLHRKKSGEDEAAHEPDFENGEPICSPTRLPRIAVRYECPGRKTVQNT